MKDCGREIVPERRVGMGDKKMEWEEGVESRAGRGLASNGSFPLLSLRFLNYQDRTTCIDSK